MLEGKTCHTQNKDSAIFCSSCGAQLEESTSATHSSENTVQPVVQESASNYVRHMIPDQIGVNASQNSYSTPPQSNYDQPYNNYSLAPQNGYGQPYNNYSLTPQNGYGQPHYAYNDIPGSSTPLILGVIGICVAFLSPLAAWILAGVGKSKINAEIRMGIIPKAGGNAACTVAILVGILTWLLAMLILFSY